MTHVTDNSSRCRHANIPVFIPHLGCPNQCVFCDQRTISGVSSFSEDGVRELLESSVRTLDGRRAEIAFFGGSFTGIDRSLMVRLLDMAEEFVRRGDVTGIRMSTRPDYIDDGVMEILSRYTVSEIELGVQSMSERVLAACRRGHTPEQTRTAARMIREAGFGFVGQMMIGLPQSSEADETDCAREICDMGAAGSRIYPTVVFRGTDLARMTETGEYTPLTVTEAAERSAAALEIFARSGVRCLRVGLCDSENLHGDERYLAGPVHPAMGEIVRSFIYRRAIEEQLNGCSDISEITVEVARGGTSAAVGQTGANRRYFAEKFGIGHIKFVENERLIGYNIKVYRT